MQVDELLEGVADDATLVAEAQRALLQRTEDGQDFAFVGGEEGSSRSLVETEGG